MEDDNNVMETDKLSESRGKWKNLLRKRVPILAWLPKYDRMTALADLIAGITLGLTLVPQSIAYASLAGLEVQYGLYTAFMGTLVYALFGTVKEVSIGPTSLMALLTLQTCRGLPIEYVVLLTFLSGVIVMIMGLLRLGFLVDLISQPVTSGFTSGTVVLIVTSQLKGLLGLKFTAESMVDTYQLLVANIHNIRTADCILSAVCITFILCMRQLKDLKVNPKRYKLKKALWLLSISRNAIVVCAAATFVYCTTNEHEEPLVLLSGRVVPGLPPFGLPAFSVVRGNTTVYFPEMVRELGSSLLMVPVIMVLANVAIAKAFSTGRAVAATQEMLALGACNLCGALAGAMPACGAFTRSAVSHSSGVRSPAAGLYSAVITILALAFMTKYFYFIPRATLSSVLVCAIIFMFDARIFGELWRRSRRDLAVLALTFVVSVARSVELAVLAGVLAQALLLLLAASPHPHSSPSSPHPHSCPARQVPGVGDAVCVTAPFSLVYLNIEKFKTEVIRTTSSVTTVFLDCSRLHLIDYSACQGLEHLSKKLKLNGQKLIIFNASPEVLERLQHTKWIDSRQLRASCELDALLVRDDSRGATETDVLIEIQKQKTGADE